MKHALACVAAAGSIACAGAPVADAPPARVETKDFSFPVPAGFAPSRDDVLAPLWANGGAGILQRAVLDVDDPFRASIAIAPVTPDLTVLTPEECEALAINVAGRLAADVVEWTNTDACRWTATRRNNPTRSMRSVIKVGRTNWTMTCSYHTRDQAAQAACVEVDERWQWRP